MSDHVASTSELRATCVRTVAILHRRAGSSPQEARHGRRQPGAGQPERPRLARRGHGAALCRRRAGRRPEAQHRRVEVTLDAGSLLALDGQRGYGQVVGEQAMALAWRARRQHGSCIMALANAHHLGRIGHFAEMAVAQRPGVHPLRQRAVAARWSRPGAAATGATAPTPAASACRCAGASPSCWTSRPAAWRRARCASPTTRAAGRAAAT